MTGISKLVSNRIFSDSAFYLLLQWISTRYLYDIQSSDSPNPTSESRQVYINIAGVSEASVNRRGLAQVKHGPNMSPISIDVISIFIFCRFTFSRHHATMCTLYWGHTQELGNFAPSAESVPYICLATLWLIIHPDSLSFPPCCSTSIFFRVSLPNPMLNLEKVAVEHRVIMWSKFWGFLPNRIKHICTPAVVFFNRYQS